MPQLIQPLLGGSLDVIGDVHGEMDALLALVHRLGYDEGGRHSEGRRLVFVGDLCDRGPDSPGVIRFVQRLIEHGCAQAICGNHELNLLRGEQKHGNHWFYGHSEHTEFGACAAVSADEQATILEFFRTLPLALERPDLRVVHAAWIQGPIEACRSLEMTVDEAYASFDQALRADPEFQTLERLHDEEVQRLGGALKDRNAAPHAREIGPYDEACQMRNPIRVLTSGVERANAKPFFASGKWRYVDRVPWWETYDGAVPVLFGHYWRWWDPAVHRHLSKGEPQLFASDSVGASMRDHHQAFCMDFSVGSRYKQRQARHAPPFHGRLAAMRWPERELVFDGDEPLPIWLSRDPPTS